MTPAARIAAVIEILTEMQASSDAGTLRVGVRGNGLVPGFNVGALRVRATGRLLVIFSGKSSARLLVLAGTLPVSMHQTVRGIWCWRHWC